ncbi:hypothetical protein [Enterococcus sp. JNUCC 77]
MNLIKKYELKYIDLEELKKRIDGVVNESLEDELGYDALEFYVRLAYGKIDGDFYIQKYGGDINGNIERKSVKNQNTEDDPFSGVL